MTPTGPPNMRTAPAVAPRGRPEVRSSHPSRSSPSPRYRQGSAPLNVQDREDRGWEPLDSILDRVFANIIAELEAE